MTMNVISSAEKRYSPYALRSRKRQKDQRYPLRSTSNLCKPSIRQPNSVDNVETFIKATNAVKAPKTIKTSEVNTSQHVSKHKFSQMNDNCILYILEHLSLADLCSIADVSVRLKQLAQYAFRLKYQTKLNLDLLSNGTDKITMKQVRSLFYNFGHFIKTLHVSRKDFEFDTPLQRPFLGQQKLFHLIGKYCSLETLTIGHFWFNMELIREALPIFAKLQTLNFYRIICYCTDQKIFQHFANVLPIALLKSGYQAPQLVQLI